MFIYLFFKTRKNLCTIKNKKVNNEIKPKEAEMSTKVRKAEADQKLKSDVRKGL